MKYIKKFEGVELPERLDKPSDPDMKKLIEDIKSDFNVNKLSYRYDMGSGVQTWSYMMYDYDRTIKIKFNFKGKYQLEISERLIYSDFDRERIKTISKYLLKELKDFFKIEYNKKIHIDTHKEIFNRVKRIVVDTNKYNL